MLTYFSDAKNPFRQNADEIVISPAAAEYARAGNKGDFVYSIGNNRTNRGIGTYPSLAMQVSFPYFSSLELAMLRYLDLMISAEFWPQPISFEIMLDGQRSKYTPDCGVALPHRRIMIETKFREDADSDENRRRWPYIEEELKNCGYEFKVVDETFLKSSVFADRLEAIQRFRRFDLDDLADFQLQSRLAEKDVWRLDEVLAEIKALGLHEDMFFASVLRRRLYIDLSADIDEASAVYVAKKAPLPPIFRD